MNLASASFPQNDIQSQMHKLTAPAESVSEKKRNTQFLTAYEIKGRFGFSEEYLLDLAKTKEVLARFDSGKQQWLFHPNAAELYSQREELLYLKQSQSLMEQAAPKQPKAMQVQNTPVSMVPINKIETTNRANQEERSNIIKRASQRAEAYFKMNNSQKAQLNKKLRSEVAKDADNNLGEFDYISHYDLKIGKNRGKHTLDLRSPSKVNKQLKKIIGQGRTTLDSNSYEGAKLEANKVIHQKCKETGNDILPVVNNDLPTVSKALKSSAVYNKDKKTKDGMFSKIAFWHHVLGELPLSAINTAIISEVEETALIQDVEKSTISGYNSELRKALKSADKKGWINGVPVLSSHKSNERRLIELPFNEAWMPFVKEYSKTIQEEKFLEFSWLSGLRKANNLQTKFEHFIQLKNGKWIMHLPNVKNKSGKAIDVAMSDKQIEIIKFMKNYQDRVAIKSDFVFALDSSGDLPDIDTDRWRSALAKRNLPNDMVFHHLRHYFATRLKRDGVELETIRRLGGWLCLGSLKRYIHCGVTDTDFEAI